MAHGRGPKTLAGREFTVLARAAQNFFRESLAISAATKAGAIALQQQQQLPGVAPQKTGALEGAVHTADGRPVGGATATLRNLASGETRKTTTTAQGIFRL